MKIINYPEMFSQRQIENIERHYKARFICETSVKSFTNNWTNYPVAVFYNEKPHPKGSNWFGLYFSTENKLMITNAISALEPFQAIKIDDEVVFSKYRHDYREHKGVFVDGGREYLRCGGQRMDEIEVVKLQIVEDHLEVVQ